MSMAGAMKLTKTERMELQRQASALNGRADATRHARDAHGDYPTRHHARRACDLRRRLSGADPRPAAEDLLYNMQ